MLSYSVLSLVIYCSSSSYIFIENKFEVLEISNVWRKYGLLFGSILTFSDPWFMSLIHFLSSLGYLSLHHLF